MKRVIAIIFVVVFLLTIIGLPVFLGPNDLAGCGEKPSDSVRCAAGDAIVAVSGGDTNARTDEAIRRYWAGWAPLLIFSGAAQDNSGPSNAQAMKNRAIEQGVPSDKVIIEEFGRTTAENASNTSRFVDERHLRRIILVTSAYHQRRASLEFGARLGPGVQIVNAPIAQDRQWGEWWWLTPSGWWLALGELVKIVFYFTSGGAT